MAQNANTYHVVKARYPAKERYWGAVAADYDEVTNGSPLRRFMGAREFSILERIAREQIPANSSILDAPTGTGRFLPLFQSMGYRITGIDISPDMLKRNLERNKQPVIRADCESVPFQDGAFDYVVSLRFLGHVPPAARVRVLKEFGRVARKGLIVGYPVLNPLTKAKFKIGNIRYKIENGRDRAWWPATSESMSRELELAGLRIDRKLNLLGALSQIVFLCLAVREPQRMERNQAEPRLRFASA